MTKSKKMAYQIHIAENFEDKAASENTTQCVIGEHICFDPIALQSYCTADWNPAVFDAMVVAAAVEACDYSFRRPVDAWGRSFKLAVPVHDPEKWSHPSTQLALKNSLGFLTGDLWNFEFRQVKEKQNGSQQGYLELQDEIETVIPYSDGIDSRAVSAIVSKGQKRRVMRVRIASRGTRSAADLSHPFARVPFKTTSLTSKAGDSSGRSRGFKFLMLAGIAAMLTGAPSITIPESGQGALGPVLVNLGFTPFDRRTHPQFTHFMSDLFEAVFDRRISVEHPMIWGTKGQTLTEYRQLEEGDSIWRQTRSCWKDARHSSYQGAHLQCGVCAACMLRRSGLYAAGYHEDPQSYIWSNLSATDFWQGTQLGYSKKSVAAREYAVAGVLHMDHLANLLGEDIHRGGISRQALILAKVLGISFDDAQNGIIRLLGQHAEEWRSFLAAIPRDSFVRAWALAS